MINKFKCENYKNLNLSEDGLDFKRVNIFIGPNNSGKTNLLEAISFFSDVVKYGANDALVKRNLSNICNKFNDTKKVSFEMLFNDNMTRDTASASNDFLTLKYGAEIQFTETNTYSFVREILSNEKPISNNYSKPFEYFTFKSTNNFNSSGYCSFWGPTRQHKSKSIDINSTETFFRQTDLIMDQLNKGTDRDGFLDNLNPTIKNVRAYLDGWFHYNIARISIKDVIKPAKMTQSDNYLALDGSNFQNLIRLYNDSDKIEQVESFLRKENIIPKLGRIYATTPTDNTVTEFSIDDKRFKLSELSDGTIRLLLLLLIAKFQKTPTIFLDEPESNLHPAWLSKVYKLVNESESQLFISTHSADLLDKFTNDFVNDDVNIFVVEDGSIKLLNQHREIIRERIDEGWELGDLYRVGDTLIGGWPW
jgi:predicted ATPase